MIVLLTSVEFDHADIYRDLDHVRESFRKLAAILPPDGLLVACADYPDVVAVAREARCPVIFYATRDGALPGADEETSWAVRGTGESGGMTGFRMEGAGRALDFRFPLPGLHNAANAAGVAIVLMRLGFLPEAIARTFERFAGIRRRQEVVGEFGGILVIDDFAHHPTAVRETIRAVRARYPGRRIVAVFEPRSNTSRRKVFQREFTAALSEADEVILAGSVRDGKDPARGAAFPGGGGGGVARVRVAPRRSSPRWTGSSPASRKRAGRATSSSSCRTAASAASRKNCETRSRRTTIGNRRILSSESRFSVFIDGVLPLC